MSSFKVLKPVVISGTSGTTAALLSQCFIGTKTVQPRTTPRTPWLIFELVLLVRLKLECMGVLMVPRTLRRFAYCPIFQADAGDSGGLTSPVSFTWANSCKRSARSKCISEIEIDNNPYWRLMDLCVPPVCAVRKVWNATAGTRCSHHALCRRLCLCPQLNSPPKPAKLQLLKHSHRAWLLSASFL